MPPPPLSQPIPLPDDGKDRLHKALAGAMRGISRKIINRQLAVFAKADPAYAEGVRKALK